MLYFFAFDDNVSSRCDSPEKLKAILPRLEQELKDTGKFKDFYQFTFNFAKNPGQKGLGKHKNNTFRNIRIYRKIQACHVLLKISLMCFFYLKV